MFKDLLKEGNHIQRDNEGNIAYKSNGNVPIRKKGDGNLPVPGYSSDYGWSGYVSYDKLPKLVNPEEGFIATANTETVKTDYHTSNVWAQPYSKGQRICRTSIFSLIFFVSHIAVLMATTSSRVWDRRERGRNSPKSRPIKNLFRIIWLLIVGRCGCCGGQIGELSSPSKR